MCRYPATRPPAPRDSISPRATPIASCRPTCDTICRIGGERTGFAFNLVGDLVESALQGDAVAIKLDPFVGIEQQQLQISLPNNNLVKPGLNNLAQLRENVDDLLGFVGQALLEGTVALASDLLAANVSGSEPPYALSTRESVSRPSSMWPLPNSACAARLRNAGPDGKWW